jgi:hypothetical protein
MNTCVLLLASTVHWGGFKFHGSCTAVDLIAASTTCVDIAGFQE